MGAENLPAPISTLPSATWSFALPLVLWTGWLEPATPAWWVVSWLLCMRECLVSLSEREKRFSQPGKVHSKGFSPVCVRI